MALSPSWPAAPAVVWLGTSAWGLLPGDFCQGTSAWGLLPGSLTCLTDHHQECPQALAWVYSEHLGQSLPTSAAQPLNAHADSVHPDLPA